VNCAEAASAVFRSADEFEWGCFESFSDMLIGQVCYDAIDVGAPAGYSRALLRADLKL
jgi:hypothetical protein